MLGILFPELFHQGLNCPRNSEAFYSREGKGRADIIEHFMAYSEDEIASFAYELGSSLGISQFTDVFQNGLLDLRLFDFEEKISVPLSHC